MHDRTKRAATANILRRIIFGVLCGLVLFVAWRGGSVDSESLEMHVDHEVAIEEVVPALHDTQLATTPTRVDPRLALLRSVLIFGDSLTAGAYYSTLRDSRTLLKFTTTDWSRVVEASLRSRLAALGPDAAASVHVEHKGYPGKDSAALAKKLRQLLRRANPRGTTTEPPTPAYSLLVIMSGTNDVVGLRNNLSTSNEHIMDMHRAVREINCRQGPSSSSACGSIALQMPPMNFSVPPEWYPDAVPRAYCATKSSTPHVQELIQHRHRTLNEYIANAFPQCHMNWSNPLGGQPIVTHGVGGMEEVRRYWSDCIHPNAEGYERFGTILADWLWRFGTDNVCH